jgi:hypothetical protein
MWTWVKSHLAGIGLAGACLGLAAVIALELSVEGGKAWLDPATLTTGEGWRSPELQSGIGVLPALEHYEEILKRPLFSSARSRIAEEDDAKTPVMEAVADHTLEQLVLTGIVLSPQERLAILRNSRTNKVMHLPQGADVGHWSLETVEHDGVTFRFRDNKKVLPLYKDRDGKARSANQKAKGMAYRPR